MAGEINRDRTIEHLLRQTLPAPLSVPTPDCLDPERLAAWSAGSLRTTDAAAVETHLADCGYCQTMLTAFVESEPAAVISMPFWRRWNARWLVPAAVATAAVVVWVNVPREGAQPMEAPASTMARVERFDAPERAAGPPPAQSAGNSAPAAAPPAAADVRVEQDALSVPPTTEQRTQPARDAVGKTTSPQAPATPAIVAPRQATDDARTAAPAAAPRGPVVAPTPPPAPAPSPAASVQAEPPMPARVAAPSTSTERVFTGGSAATGDLSQSNFRMAGVSNAATPIAVHARADRTGPSQFGPPTPAQFSFTANTDTGVTPATASAVRSSVRWQIHPDGRLERSFDDGRTWSAVTVEGASPFTAGSAPLDGICWLVDREAGVWRSTGGGAFERVSFSANAPLVAIEALDARRASVTTSDGREFTTIDGGTTWRITP